MDFQGPLYDVRMSRGQGYNSYIQEVRMHNAVKITRIKKKASTTASASDSPEADATSESSQEPPGEPSKAPTEPSKAPAEPSKPTVEPSKPAGPPPNWNDFFPALLDYMSKNNAQPAKPNEPKVLPYLMPTPSGKVNQTVLFSSKQVSEISEINRAMGFKASAAVKAASIGPGAEVSSNLASTDDFKGQVLNFLIHVKVVNEKPDREEEWEFKDIEGLVDRLDKIKDEVYQEKLKKEDPLQAERRYKSYIAHLRAVEFTRIYGDTVISDFVEGGEIYALVGIRSRKKAISSDLIAYASAQLTPAAVPIQVKAETEVNKQGKEDFDQSETSIRVQWRGGGQIKNHDFAWGLDSLIQIANAFPSFVAVTSAKIRAVLTPYSSVRDFQRLQIKFPEHPLTLNYDRCALFAEALYEDYQAFRSMWVDIGAMLANPEKYSPRKEVDKKAHNAQPAAELGSEIPARTSREIIFTDAASQQADGTMAGRRGTMATVSVQDMASSIHGDGSSGIAITDVAGILKIKKEATLGILQPTNTHSLSRLRLICHSAMLHIQKLAADLVIDPHVVESHSDEEGGDIPRFMQPRYPYPGTIKRILPVPKETGEGATPWDDSHYQILEDLHIPTSIMLYPGAKHPDDTRYAWNCYGDNLSDYKKYEHFQIGNFDPSDTQYPQAIAFMATPSSIMGYVNKKAKNDENMISGIALRYWNPLNAKYTDLENTILQDVKSTIGKTGQGEVASSTYGFCGGKPPLSENDWNPLSNEFDTAPFNRVCFYYKQGSGRIGGLELHRDGEIDGQVQLDSEKKPVASHQSWKEGAKSSPRPPQFIAVPGDGIGPNKLWQFAGFVGAFEKTGALKRDRALAKIAVIWKKRQDITADVDI